MESGNKVKLEEKDDPSTKVICWIDARIKAKENQRYVNQLKEKFPKCIVGEAESIEEGIKFLESFIFPRVVYVITSGSLSQDYMNDYEKHLKKLFVITKNIIFCGTAKYHEWKVFANDKFFNPGGIVTKFRQVIDIIDQDKVDIKLEKESKEEIKEGQHKIGWGFSFKEVNYLSQLAVPTMLGKFIPHDRITKEDYQKFLNEVKKICHNKQYLSYLAQPTKGINQIEIPY